MPFNKAIELLDTLFPDVVYQYWIFENSIKMEFPLLLSDSQRADIYNTLADDYPIKDWDIFINISHDKSFVTIAR